MTDSGLGGLSIAAGFLAASHRYAIPLNLIYFNALPAQDRGYNRMRNQAEKIAVFNQVLTAAIRRFDPRVLAVACNTLAVLLPEIPILKAYSGDIVDIIYHGTIEVQNQIEPDEDCDLIIFGTETTIQADVHRSFFSRPPHRFRRVVAQSCRGLPSAIERGSTSTLTNRIINESVRAALRQLPDKSRKVTLLLACTHFGYVADVFRTALQQAGVTEVRIIDPNSGMIKRLIKSVQSRAGQSLQPEDIRIRILSKCPLLGEEITTIANLVRPVSEEIATALENYELLPDLF